MPLSLEQYATYLDTRDLPWPSPPPWSGLRPNRSHASVRRARRVVERLWHVAEPCRRRAILRASAALIITSPSTRPCKNQNVGLDVAQARQPRLLGQIYRQVLLEQKMTSGGGEKHPETSSERVWRRSSRSCSKGLQVRRRLFGSLNEFSRKWHTSFTPACKDRVAIPARWRHWQHVNSRGLAQGLLADSQCFTWCNCSAVWQTERERETRRLHRSKQRWLSHSAREKPSERLFARPSTHCGNKDRAKGNPALGSPCS